MKIIHIAYNQEIGFLSRYLKQGFDPYDYTHYLEQFINDNYPDDYESLYAQNPDNLEDYELAEKWLAKATTEQIDAFRDYIWNLSSAMDDPWAPAYQHMHYEKFVKPTWLIHFTNDPYQIEENGFEFGHAETEGLGLTTWKSNRKESAGFNFAFDINDRDVRSVSKNNKYGKHAVVFWGAGVQALHYGDEEHQILVWGPSIDKNLIFPIINEYGEWTIYDDDERMRFQGDIEDAIQWIITNYRMLQNIEERNNRYQRQKEQKELKETNAFNLSIHKRASAINNFETSLTSFITKWIKTNCQSSLEALYGMCIEMSDAISKFLTHHQKSHTIWGLWALSDKHLSSLLPLRVTLDNNQMNALLKKSNYTLTDIGYEVHEVIEWNGGFWDANGKQTMEQIKSNFDTDNDNLHFFLLDQR